VSAHNREDKKTPYLEGDAAIAAARSILASPGLVGCDFETWPTDPAWHKRQAAAAAPLGQKQAAGEQAEALARINGRAHLRRPCTLQLAHEDGREVFIRLDPGEDPEPRRRQLRAMFEGRQAELIAHLAQFECEVLLAAGIPADIHCTWLMARSLHLVAVPKGAPQPRGYGLADCLELDLDRPRRDKSIRDRDWREEAALDAEGIAYGLQDARDVLDLYRLYRAQLEEAGLWEGYLLLQ
jgi:hypothetical protein